jgi:hypothetical protein
MSPETLKLIEEFGDQAYHKAVSFVVIASQFNDTEGMKIYSDASIELIQNGYHKHPKEENQKK